MFCWTRDITLWKSAWMTSAQLWSRRHHWPWADVIRADFQTVISRYLHNVNTRFFCTADRMFGTIIMQNFRLIYACFSYQNRRGLNRPILRPLWLMMSAAADVISVPSVMYSVSKTFFQTSSVCSAFRVLIILIMSDQITSEDEMCGCICIRKVIKGFNAVRGLPTPTEFLLNSQW